MIINENRKERKFPRQLHWYTISVLGTVPGSNSPLEEPGSYLGRFDPHPCITTITTDMYYSS